MYVNKITLNISVLLTTFLAQKNRLLLLLEYLPCLSLLVVINYHDISWFLVEIDSFEDLINDCLQATSHTHTIHFPSTPSWLGAQLKQQGQLYL
jgi:hypothetical protein